jgi:hypothetical protein
VSYEVFARKYRPQTFDDIVGQNHVTRTLKNAVEQNRLAHAYLFVGPRGTGKTSTARILAKALNCIHGPTVTPCGKCDNCREIAGGNSLDVIELDAAGRGVDVERRVLDDIVMPVLQGMQKEGTPFRGFLYVGLMLTSSGPKVIEFNVRLGDPEAQVVLPLVDEPLLPILAAAAGGALRQSSVRVGRDSLTGVVVASRGYPESSESGHTIRGVELAEAIPGVAVYHAATARRGDDLVTAGGRVLTVVGRGATFADAMARAYAGVEQIQFDGMQYRRDIGRNASRSAG